jgi:serine/threonine-protein kinase
LRSIGDGASSVVWEAEHTELQRRVALKVLSAELAGSRVSLERFRQEARVLAALSHPNLVQILDFGRSLDGRVFMAMELLAGETLEARLRRAPVNALDATRIAIKACAALEAAHAAGLVHRDIKPQNLMLTNAGGVKLLDFGVATAPLGRADKSVAGVKERSLRALTVFGTPQYMAPEQVAGEAIDHRTDVYALGCVLYEMLVGAPPFDGSSLVVMGKHLRETPEPLRARTRGGILPGRLKEVVMRAMAKDPRRRFVSAGAMQAALQVSLLAYRRRQSAGRRLVNVALLVIAACAAAGVSARWTRKLMTLGVEPAAALTPAAIRTPTAMPIPTASAPRGAAARDTNSPAGRRALSLPGGQL